MSEMNIAPERSRLPLLQRLGLHRPELRAWAMYDWANSAMVTVIITAVFPIYFRSVAAGGSEQALGRYGFATALSILIVAVLAPILGAMADFAGIKKPLLGAFMGLGVAAVASMFFIEQGNWVLALVLFLLANIGATGSFVFYDALLPHIASDEEMDRVSTAGFAMGYVGGGLVLGICLLLISRPQWFGMSEGTLPVRVSFVITGVWWLIFAIPLFRQVPEPARSLEPDESRGQNPLRVAFVRLGETFRELRGYRNAFLMLIAFLIYSDGIGTIIRMAAIYGAEIGIDDNVMIAAILLTQFVGIPCAFGFGMLAGVFGAKPCIFFGIGIYALITLIGFFMTSGWHFLLLAVLVGMVQGGTQALSRSLFASMIPRHKSGEFFGFFGVMDKFAGSMGTALMTALAIATSQSRFGILGVIVLFILGAVLLALVDVRAGQQAARSIDAQIMK
jgi:MFS transporter, UMF1 family